MADSKVSALTTIPAVDRAADIIYIVDMSAGTSNKVTPNGLLGISGAPVGDTDSATLTNKTITSPAISSPTLSGTIAGTYTIGGTPTFPSSVVTLTGSQTLTNKILTSPTINTPTITNPTLSTDSVSEFTSANGVSIDGLNIKDSKLNTSNSVVTTSITDGAVTPAKLVTGSGTGWTWQAWTPTWTNLTVGNGSVTARYTQIGKTVVGYLRFVMGTTSVMGSGCNFTVPVAVSSSTYDNSKNNIVGTVEIDDATVANYNGLALFSASITAITPFVTQSSSTYASSAGFSSTVPFTWGNTDYFTVRFEYEAA